MLVIKILTIVYGTRGELIKFSSLVKELQKRKINFAMVDTHQQDTKELRKKLNLPQPDYALTKSPRKLWSRLSADRLIKLKRLGPYGIAGSVVAGFWGAIIINKLRKIFKETRGPIIYLGNTLTVLLAVYAAKSLKNAPLLIDYEAGLRTNENSLLDFLYKVGEDAADMIFIRSLELRKNLNDAGGKVVYIGNPVTETVKLALSYRPTRKLPKKGYVLANTVRAQNEADLREIVMALEKSPLPVIYIPNPAVRHVLERLKEKLNIKIGNIKILESLDYINYIHLLKNSVCAITDSNGVEEECAALGKPCIVTNNFLQYKRLKNYNIFVAGCNRQKILSAIEQVKRGVRIKKIKPANATSKAVDVIEKFLKSGEI